MNFFKNKEGTIVYEHRGLLYYLSGVEVLNPHRHFYHIPVACLFKDHEIDYKNLKNGTLLKIKDGEFVVAFAKDNGDTFAGTVVQTGHPQVWPLYHYKDIWMKESFELYYEI